MGESVWLPTPLTNAIKLGRLCILDGLHRLPSGTISALVRLVQDREVTLNDGTRFVSPRRWNILLKKLTLKQLKARNVRNKRRRSNVALIIVKVLFISLFLFYCLLCNHSFTTNPNSVTNCFKLFSLLQLYNYIAPASLIVFLKQVQVVHPSFRIVGLAVPRERSTRRWLTNEVMQMFHFFVMSQNSNLDLKPFVGASVPSCPKRVVNQLVNIRTDLLKAAVDKGSPLWVGSDEIAQTQYKNIGTNEDVMVLPNTAPNKIETEADTIIPAGAQATILSLRQILRTARRAGKYSKRCRSNIAVIIDIIDLISSFLFYFLLLNHSFPTHFKSV